MINRTSEVCEVCKACISHCVCSLNMQIWDTLAAVKDSAAQGPSHRQRKEDTKEWSQNNCNLICQNINIFFTPSHCQSSPIAKARVLVATHALYSIKPWHTIDETVMILAPPQCQSFSIKSCLVFVNGLIASDIAVLKFSTEYLVQGGCFSWPVFSILHTSSSIPIRKASENHRAER